MCGQPVRFRPPWEPKKKNRSNNADTLPMQSVPFDGDSLLMLTSALQAAVSYFTSIQVQRRMERFDLHSLPQFGICKSQQRLCTIASTVNHMMLELGHLEEGLARCPSIQQLRIHSSRGRLHLCFQKGSRCGAVQWAS